MSETFKVGGRALLAACLVAVGLLPVMGTGAAIAQAGMVEVPVPGTEAPDFTLATPEGKALRMSSLLGRTMVVMVWLRGYPGSQSPECQKQAHDFKARAEKFRAQGVELLLVYPGPAGQVSARAREFLKAEGALPANFHLVVDPDEKVTARYGLRWDAPQETAYPATFVIAPDGEVRFRKVSQQHGDRTTADEMLDAVAKAREEEGGAVPR